MPIESPGLAFRQLSRAEFKVFAQANRISPEIGSIVTRVDGTVTSEESDDIHLLGLTGCGVVCAAACCVLMRRRNGPTRVCKLDSVIVDRVLRRRGLAKILVSEILTKVVSEPRHRIDQVSSIAVHPATVRILKQLSFSGPPLTGAPLMSVHLDDANRERFPKACLIASAFDLNCLKLQCALCRQGDRRAARWCQPTR